MTFVELLAVSAVLLMMAGAMAALAINVQESGRYHLEQGLSLQHGLVVLQRIQRTLSSAQANEEFPGFLVCGEAVQGKYFPDTLVAWYAPSGVANPDGLPLVKELAIFCPNPEKPNELWELTCPADGRTAPDPADLAAWQNLIAELQESESAEHVVLTDLLRVATVTNGTGDARDRRGVVRFDTALRPSAAEWSEFQAGTRSWDSLSWAQGIHGTGTGLRQNWCRFELQLRPGESGNDSQETAIPLFGSGAVYYEMQKP